MADFGCIICGACNTSTEPETVYEASLQPESRVESVDNDENVSIADAFVSFCDQMQIKQTSNLFNFWTTGSHGPPLCAVCRQTVTQVFHLTVQLQRIQNDLNGLLDTVREKAQSVIKKMNECDNFQSLDENVVNFRYAMIGRNLEEKNEGEGKESARDEEASAVEVSSQDSDSSSNHSEWAPSKTRVNTVNSKRSRREARESRRRDNSDNADGVESPCESSDSDSVHESSSTSKKSRKSSTHSKDSNSEHQVGGNSASAGNLEYYGFRYQSVAGRYKCQECPDCTFTDKSQIFAHIRENHFGKTRGCFCSICGKHCDSRSALRTHETSHSDVRDWICCTCGKGFKNEKNLKRHMKERHDLNFQLCCFLCLREFKTNLEVKLHIKNEHMSEVADKSKYCDSCGKTFKNDHVRERHLKVHEGEKYFKCYYCEKLYLQKANIKIHFEKEHGLKD